jgi:serine/threonine protein kinase
MFPAIYAGDVVDGQYRITTALAAKGKYTHITSATVLGQEATQEVAIKSFVEPNETVRDFVSREIAVAKLLDGTTGVQPFLGSGVFRDITGIDYRYLVTRLEACDLAHYMPSIHPNDMDRKLRLGINIARALEAVHNMGIIHRDVKAGNVLIGRDGEARLTDFGIIEVPEVLDRVDNETLRKAGSLAIWSDDGDTNSCWGTVGSMAPEVMRNEQLDYSSDVFSVGVMTHELLAGEHPWPQKDGEMWKAKHLRQYFQQIHRESPRSARAANRNISVSQETLLREAYDPHPENRPTSKELVAGLQQ